MDTYRTILSDAQRELARLDELKTALELAIELGDLLVINVPARKALKTVNQRIQQIKRDEEPTIFYRRYEA